MAILLQSLERLRGYLDKLASLTRVWTGAMPIPTPMFFVLPPRDFSELMVDIVFYSEFTQVNRTSITDFNALREMGDQKIMALVNSLNGSGTGKSGGDKLRATFCIMSMSIGILIFALF
jgi:hypothetical protein